MTAVLAGLKRGGRQTLLYMTLGAGLLSPVLAGGTEREAASGTAALVDQTKAAFASRKPHHQQGGRAAFYETGCTRCHTPPAVHADGYNCRMCHVIDRLPGGGGVDHAQVESGECATCHDNHYMPQHYGGHCLACHTTRGWRVRSPQQISGSLECSGCHGAERPYQHYGSVPCWLCHQGTTWQAAFFEHAGLGNCESCHERPRRHRPGACVFCHDTVDWANAS